MKKILLLLYLVSPLFSNSQNEMRPPNLEKYCLNNFISPLEEVILCDSIYGYDWKYATWRDDKRDYFYFNERGDITLKEIYGLNDSDDWTIEGHYEWIYDENNLFIEFLDQRIDPGTSEFGNYYYHYHTFNDQDLMVEDLIQKWDIYLNVWYDKWKVSLTYGENGLLIHDLWEVWDAVLEIWEIDSQSSYSYNENGDRVEELVQLWDYSNETWINDKRYYYSYSDLNQMEEEIWSDWNNDQEIWEDKVIYDYTYDTNGFLIEILRTNWEQLEGEWLIYYKRLFINDDDGNLLERLELWWNYMEEGWVNAYNDIYYNSNHIVGNKMLEEYDIVANLYPNPAGEHLFIGFNKNLKINEVNIYDQTGQVIINNKNPTSILDVSMLQSGLYIVEVITNNNRIREKLLIN